ncbi:hypothetical protein KJ068_00690 [bacterium]|nr:hypothetical protein [bacterium]
MLEMRPYIEAYRRRIPFETYKYQAEIIEKGQVLYEFNREQDIAPAQRCAGASEI